MKIRVFLADDHAIIRDGLTALLEAEGDIAVVGAAADGRDAVRQVGLLRPDVVIADITMPQLNGIEAADQMREVSPETKTIILSIHSTLEHIGGAMRAGAKGYLLKETAGREIVDAVRAVQAGRHYLSQSVSAVIADGYAHIAGGGVAGSPFDKLSRREREVMQLLVEGRSSSEIAQVLFLSVNTVDTYRSRIMHKLGIKDLPGLVKLAVLHGMTPLSR